VKWLTAALLPTPPTVLGLVRTKKGYAWSGEHNYNVTITRIAISQTCNSYFNVLIPMHLYIQRKTTGYLEVQYC